MKKKQKKKLIKKAREIESEMYDRLNESLERAVKSNVVSGVALQWQREIIVSFFQAFLRMLNAIEEEDDE